MKIAIVGAGAMGSVYAALMADAGNEVWAIDVWREHVETINRDGLRVEGASGDRIVSTVQASASIGDAGQCDLYIIATKASGVGDAARAVSGVMGPNSLVLTIQNGLGAGERIAEHMSTDNVLLGVAAGFGASMRAPGHAHHNSMSLIRIGELNGGLTERVERVAEVWRSSGFNVKAFEDIEQPDLGEVHLQLHLLRTLHGIRLHHRRDHGNARPLGIAKGCALEIHALGQAKGVNFGFDDPITYVTAFGENMPEARPSMLLDHHARRPSEIDAINGMAEVLGPKLGVATPINQTLSAIVRDRERRFWA